MKKLVSFVLAGLTYLSNAQGAEPLILQPGLAPGLPCWGRADRPNEAVPWIKGGESLVCRNGVFKLASENPRWEEYRNIPAEKSTKLIAAATKEGAACHELRDVKIVVCYWR